MKKLPPKETRFKKGRSGNPQGRPRKLPALNDVLAKILGSEPGSTAISKIEKIIAIIAHKALRGDVRCAEFLIERAYGKLKMSVDTRMQNVPPIIISDAASPELKQIMEDVRKKMAEIDEEHEENQQAMDERSGENNPSKK